MDDGPKQAGSDRERARVRLRELVKEREQLERRSRDLTEELHQAMRTAHQVGWTWSEIAAFAKYKTAATARSQATPRSKRPPPEHPPDTYSVREAARLLGVSPQTIYTWIGDGRLELADHPGKSKRVFVPGRKASAGETE